MNVPKLTRMTVIGFMRFVSTKQVVTFVNVKTAFMVRDWIAQVNETQSKQLRLFSLNSLSSNEKFHLVRGDVISTHQPYRADEKWESAYVCQPGQFVALKFDIMEFSKVANDILRIQLLTAEESEF